VLRWATGNSDSQDSPRLGLGGSHHLPPYSILCASPRGPHPNGILSRDSQVRVSKFSQFGLLWFWGSITSRVDLWLQWGLKQSCSPCQELSNGMSHTACTQGNKVDSWLLVVGSQIANLTLGLSFDHNLCFRCPNGRCEPILDTTFQYLSNDIKNSLSPWVLTLAIVLWRFRSPLGLQLPTWEFTWECEGSFLHTFWHS
jgi:hypothetical protein